MEIAEDSKMARTSVRPLPSGVMLPEQAEFIKNMLFLSSNSFLYFGNICLTSIAFSNITYFSYILYIKLKKKTELNTLFGAFVGSLPMLVGMTHA